MNNNFYQNGQFGGWMPPQYTNYYTVEDLQKREKEEQKKKIRSIGSKCGLAVILYVVFSFGVSLLIGLIGIFFPNIYQVLENITATLSFDIITTYIAIGIPFLIVFLLLKKQKFITELPFGTTYNRKAAVSLVMMFVPLMIFSAVAINYISAIFQSILGIEFTSSVDDMKITGIGGTFIGTLAIAVVPAMIEEIAIRGIVMQPLRKYGDSFAIIASSLLFACMHGNMVQIPYTVVGGMLLGILAVKTGSLWPSIVLHFINNFYSVVIVSVNDNVSENASWAATLIMFALFIISGIIGTLSFIKLKYKMPLSKGELTVKLTLGERIVPFIVNAPMIIAIILLGIITISNINF